jgi:hypothetical protein
LLCACCFRRLGGGGSDYGYRNTQVVRIARVVRGKGLNCETVLVRGKGLTLSPTRLSIALVPLKRSIDRSIDPIQSKRTINIVPLKPSIQEDHCRPFPIRIDGFPFALTADFPFGQSHSYKVSHSAT